LEAEFNDCGVVLTGTGRVFSKPNALSKTPTFLNELRNAKGCFPPKQPLLFGAVQPVFSGGLMRGKSKGRNPKLRRKVMVFNFVGTPAVYFVLAFKHFSTRPPFRNFFILKNFF
jgi:hypothetical protein